MINELFLYGRKDSVFKNVIAQVSGINRYHVSPNYGYDLNTSNLQSFLRDKAYGFVDANPKYPICVCVTPTSTPTKINGSRWEIFKFSLFFMERTGVGNINPEVFISEDEEEDSWSRMKNAAMDFLDLLELTLRGNVTVDDEEIMFRRILTVDFDAVRIRRLSNFNADKLSGVELVMNASLSIAECEVIVGDISYIVNTMLPEIDPVWNEDKENYYTKAQTYNKDEIDAMLGTPSEEVDFITVTAGQNLSSWRIVYIDNGVARYFDPEDVNMVNYAIAITKEAVLSGNPIKVQTEGIFKATGLGLTPNTLYFAGPNGQLISSVEGLNVIQEVGNSISSESLDLQFDSVTVLS